MLFLLFFFFSLGLGDLGVFFSFLLSLGSGDLGFYFYFFYFTGFGFLGTGNPKKKKHRVTGMGSINSVKNIE